MFKKYLVALFVLCGLSSSLMAENIYPISREMGSGTRGAFVDIFDVKKQIGNKKIDATSKKAEVTNSTGVMITTVANSKNAIGYISLGSLNDTVKAVKIDGVTPSVENVNNKSYTVFRPFNLAVSSNNELVNDFLAYIGSNLSKNIIQKAGYIAIYDNEFSSAKPSGKIVVAGSSSITPLMEKLKEGYKLVNPNATIEIQQSDSTTGINSAIEKIADIAMVSREFKDNELKSGLKTQILALDGLAVIVNKENSINSLSKESVKKIFTGEITDWNRVK
ncbi:MULTISPECIES: substrate-binding domain-containing protein [Campylobacter]|uniref:Substrate-binding domain-containing protein n=1 Tax=Campylobacter vicugnae TaxID=1660076 RepID=A0ABZ2E7K4_9BACT|nr:MULTISPECIES: substrate-binding domain-containing protein [unclassified Campylobacter]ARR04652.1 phosphate ABC transporter, periplasmic phosphate-binding protein [Campylobacter sp. RM12175]MCR8701383.1 substrate-binding domain-containing protein [Campylobacter sp. RM12176]